MTGGPVEPRVLSATGTLFAVTYVGLPWPGIVDPSAGGGYGVGLVDLPEGVRVPAVLIGDDGAWEIGMTMEVAALPFAETGGVTSCVHSFAPSGAAVAGR